MKSFGIIDGLKKLQNKLRGLKRKARQETIRSVVVGYTAAYAIYVHENLEMKWKGLPRKSGRGSYWDPQGKGQSKFLEQPAREMQAELGRVIVEVTRTTGSLQQGMLAAGLRLQRASQQLVPVDRGNLKNSAFTILE